MSVTLEQIEEGLGQIKANMATKKEVTELIDTNIEEDKEEQKAEIEEKIEGTEQTIVELKAANDDLANQVKTLVRTRFNAIKTSGNRYNGVWDNHEQARNFGLFILGHVAGLESARDTLKAQDIEIKHITERAMGEGTLPAGGALVPTEFIPELILLMENYGVFRRNAQEYPMPTDHAIAPEVTSGLTVYCPGEGKTITKSDIGLRNVGMTAKKWATLTAISSELGEDAAIAIGELVGRMIARAFAKKEDEVGFLGDGTSTYFGHTGITGALRGVDATIANIKSLVVGSGDTYAELALVDFESLLGALPDFAEDGRDVKWYCSRKFYFTVMLKLALASSGVNATEIIAGRGAKEKTYLGYPVEFAQTMPKTTAVSQICAIFGNLRMGTYLGDRSQLTIAQSREAFFEEDQVGIRSTERVAPTVFGVGDTTNAGPICGLITAAT